MQEQRRVYDSDVRSSPYLRSIGEQYVREYVGDFEPMVNAQKMLTMGHALPESVIRVALNTLRYDLARTDLQEAVSAVLRHPSAPEPIDLAEVVPITREARRRSHRRDRPVLLRYDESQFTVKARFATAMMRNSKAVLHWLRPTGHELTWKLRWERLQWEEGWDSHIACDTMTARGSGYAREFSLNVRAFCKHMNDNYYMLWSERPLESDVWPEKGADRFLPDCKGCLRVIGLEYMDMYPPDRLESGEYPEGWR